MPLEFHWQLSNWVCLLRSTFHLCFLWGHNIQIIISNRFNFPWFFYTYHAKNFASCQFENSVCPLFGNIWPKQEPIFRPGSQCKPYLLWRYYRYPFFISVINPWFRASWKFCFKLKGPASWSILGLEKVSRSQNDKKLLPFFWFLWLFAPAWTFFAQFNTMQLPSLERNF